MKEEKEEKDEEEVSFSSLKRKRNNNVRKKQTEVIETRKSPPLEETKGVEEENQNNLSEIKNKLNKRTKNFTHVSTKNSKSEKINTEGTENEQNISQKLIEEVKKQIYDDEQKEKANNNGNSESEKKLEEGSELNTDDPLYKGKSNYKSFVEPSETMIKGAGFKAGPVRASNYIRRIISPIFARISRKLVSVGMDMIASFFTIVVTIKVAGN